MRVTISHAAKTEGMLAKKNYFDVTVSVQFSPEEQSTIAAYDLGGVVVLEREPPARARIRPEIEATMFYLKIAPLMRGSETYSCSTPLEAKNYDTQLREALSTLKVYLDANATPLSGSETFEL